jgi:hypothetical protein
MRDPARAAAVARPALLALETRAANRAGANHSRLRRARHVLAQRVCDRLQLLQHLSNPGRTAVAFLARDELLEISGRRFRKPHPAHAEPDAWDAPAVEQIANVFSCVVIAIEAACAQRDGDGAFGPADQIDRPRDFDTPHAGSWIDRLRRKASVVC